MDDVVVIGGSFAGLMAAMHLVRARRSVTIIDSGRPRNRFAKAAHNVLGFDGRPPLEIRAAGLADVLAYPTARHIVGEAIGVGGVEDDFVVRLEGGQTLAARRLILAYGVADQLPDIPGFDKCWGRTVIHCPYCHGYELGGGTLGLLYSSPASLHATALLADWSEQLVLFTNGLDLPDKEEERLAARGVRLFEGRLTDILHTDGQLHAVRLESGREVPLSGLLAHPRVRPASSLHEHLSVKTEDSPLGPYIWLDDEYRTSVPGVFAAGDVAAVRHSINGAIHGGMLAGVSCHSSLLDWS